METKNHITILILLLAGMLLTLMPGCNNSSNEDITTQDFAERVSENAPKLNSYLINTQIIMNGNGEVEGINKEMVFTLGGEGAVDIKAKKSNINMSVNAKLIDGEEISEESSEMSNYIIDTTMYIGAPDEDGTMIWDNHEVSNIVWEEGLQSRQLIELLENSQINGLAKEKIDGQSCFAVELTPDTSLLWEALINQMGQTSAGSMDEIMSNSMTKTVVRYWFVQNTLFLKKVYLYAEIELDAEDMGIESGYMKYIFEMTLILDNHNGKMNIKLPFGIQTD